MPQLPVKAVHGSNISERFVEILAVWDRVKRT